MPELPPPFDTVEAEKLHQLYAEIGLHKNNEISCEHLGACAKSCEWDQREIWPPTGGYVGTEYFKHRILFVGINANRETSAPARFYDSYEWLSHDKSPESRHIDGVIYRFLLNYFREKLDHSETRKRFAFTNLIKCSVNIRAAEPTQAMYDNCGIRLGTLFEEIAILKPNVVVCIGTLPFDAILWKYVEHVIPDSPEWKRHRLETKSPYLRVIRLINPPQGYRSMTIPRKQFQSQSLCSGFWGFFATQHGRDIGRLKLISDQGIEPDPPWIHRDNYLYEAYAQAQIEFLRRP